MAVKTIIIHAGESVTLPVGTHIDAIIINGSASVTSTCGGLPTPENQVCYAMEWSASQNAASNYTLEAAEAFINYIVIGGVQYDINIEAIGGGGALTLAFMNIASLLPGIFDFVSLTEIPLANRYDLTLLFKSIPSVATEIEMNITGDGFPTNGLFVKPFESDECP